MSKRKAGGGRLPDVVPDAMEDPLPDLPDDIIEDIFARLPSRSVHRCRCLSRAWAVALATDDFTDLHHRLANRHGGPRILFVQNSRSPAGHPKVQAWSPANPGGTTLTEIPLNPAPRVVTHQCRGLVILQAAGAHHVLNPCTGRVAALPESRMVGCRVGLGYDARTRKHKAVRIGYLPEYLGYGVYEINSGPMVWRPAKGCAPGKPDVRMSEIDVSVFAQGRVHWLAMRSNETFIFSFSLEDETVGIVPSPPLDMYRNFYYQNKYSLTEHGGRLCLFHTEITDNIWLHATWPLRHDVWLLREHDTGVWDLHCRIDLDMVPRSVVTSMHYADWVFPFAMADNGCRIIFIQPRFMSFGGPSFQLCVYNPVTGDMENLLNTMPDSTRKASYPPVTVDSDFQLYS